MERRRLESAQAIAWLKSLNENSLKENLYREENQKRETELHTKFIEALPTNFCKDILECFTKIEKCRQQREILESLYFEELRMLSKKYVETPDRVEPDWKVLFAETNNKTYETVNSLLRLQKEEQQAITSISMKFMEEIRNIEKESSD